MSLSSDFTIIVRETTPDDRQDILHVETEAFRGFDDAVPQLVSDMFVDETANPLISLLAIAKNTTTNDEEVVGHVMFSRATLDPPNDEVQFSCLAPLAVLPKYQKQGIGGKLIAEGCQRLIDAGVDLVVLMGHPSYYPRHGFVPAFPQNLRPTHSIPEGKEDAWMVKELREGVLGTVEGHVICCKVLEDATPSDDAVKNDS